MSSDRLKGVAVLGLYGLFGVWFGWLAWGRPTVAQKPAAAEVHTPTKIADDAWLDSRLRASLKSKVYHRRGCVWVRRIADKDLVSDLMPSHPEAPDTPPFKVSDYRPCRFCRPDIEDDAALGVDAGSPIGPEAGGVGVDRR